MVGHFIGIRVLLLWGVVLCKWVQRLPWFNLGLDQLFLGPFGCGEGWYVNVHLSCDPISGKPPAHPNKNVQPSAFLPHKKVFIRIELASVCRYQSGVDQQYWGDIEWQRWRLQWLLACRGIVDVNPIPLTFFSGFVPIISDQHNFGITKWHILMISKRSTCTLHMKSDATIVVYTSLQVESAFNAFPPCWLVVYALCLCYIAFPLHSSGSVHVFNDRWCSHEKMQICLLHIWDEGLSWTKPCLLP